MRKLLMICACGWMTVGAWAQNSPNTGGAVMPVGPRVPQPGFPLPQRAPTVPSQPAPAPVMTTGAGGRSMVGAPNFQGTPLQAVLEYYAKVTGRSIIQAPNLAGVVYFQSQTDLTKEEVVQALDSVLAVNGIAVLPQGEKFLKVVQIATSPTEAPPVGINTNATNVTAADTVMTQVVPLKFADPSEVLTAIQPYMHTFGKVIALARSNSLLITDTGGNINQMLEIVRYMDQPSALKMEMKIYCLTNSKPTEVQQRLMSIIQESQQAGARSVAPVNPAIPPALGGRMSAASTVGKGDESVVEGKVILTPDDRTNKLIVMCRATNFEFFDNMIKELDAKVEPDVITKVVPLRYAQAEDLAGQLTSLIGGGSYTPTRRTTGSSSTRSGSTSTTRPVTMPSPMLTGGTPSATGGTTGAASGLLEFGEGVRILPDPRTNALLIMATKKDMERLEKLVTEMDEPVAQVLVEVIIGEVTLDNEMDTGVNWINRVMNPNGHGTTYGGQVTQQDSSGNPVPQPLNLGGLAAGATPTGAALSSALTYFATFKGLKLDVAINLMSKTSKFKVLSTPIIQTRHNQEASIVVGESRPIITSTLSGITTVTSSNQAGGSFQSNVEYKDIAIELYVTPLINPDGYVVMDIDQKINDIGGFVSVSGNDQPIITKREAKSSVTVLDQNTIVLGGLIKEQNGLTEKKVPFLGDIPVVGRAFKSSNRTKTRTELIVFIRPTVLRTPEQGFAEAQRRGQALKGAKELELPKTILGETNQISAATTPVTPPLVAPHDETARRSAKMKALNEQTSNKN